MLLTLLTHQYSSLSPFSFLWGETTPVFTFLTQFVLWCFVGVAMSARRSCFWMASLCWQSLWQQFWQPTTSVALVYIVWGEVVANATTRKDPSVLLSSAGRCLWCSHSGKDPTEPSGDGVNLSHRCSWVLEILVLQCEEDEWKLWEILGVGFRELQGHHFCSLTFSREGLHSALLCACIWSVQHHVGEVLTFLCVIVGNAQKSWC